MWSWRSGRKEIWFADFGSWLRGLSTEEWEQKVGCWVLKDEKDNNMEATECKISFQEKFR